MGCYCHVGGLVGDHNAGTIDNSHSSVDVSGPDYPGGLVGVTAGDISNSYATGPVHAPRGAAPFAGGLASVAYSTATITDSYATGTVTSGEFGEAGGLIGGNQAQIVRCYATGDASDGGSGGDAYVGGLVAYNTGSIADSYARGSLQEASGEIGGLVGHNQGTIATSYSTGLVSSPSGGVGGGLIGVDQTGGTVDSYWDTDASGIANLSQGAGSPQNDPGITGLTTKQLTSKLPSGFSSSVWGQNKLVNNALPYLRTIPPKH